MRIRLCFRRLWLNRPVRIIYMSPHLDDSVISAGGLIRSQSASGLPVEIWTFMAGVPRDPELPQFAQVMHYIWGFTSGLQAVESRRLEDQCGCQKVGAKPVHLDFLDCIYRRGRDGQPLYSDITLPIQPDDEDLPAQVASTMAAGLQPDDHVVCQLAIGEHVDHMVVRKAAEMLGRPLTYIADIPYLLNHPEQYERNVTGLEMRREPISQADFETWIAGIECYASQVDSVFGSHDAMLEAMRTFWEEQHSIPTWSVPGAS